MQNVKIEKPTSELEYYKKRIQELTDNRNRYMDNITQANISYEINFCKAGIKRLSHN